MLEEKRYDVIVVGGGAAGLTSAAYLSKKGYRVLLCEKEEKTGGLVGGFDYREYYFDTGLRAFENAGIIFPMLKQLDLDIDMVKSPVSIGIESELVKLESEKSLLDYEEFLSKIYPDNKKDIKEIIEEIKKVMKYMDVIYGIDNPLFIDYQEDLDYIFKTLLPWLFKYQINITKAMKLDVKINDYLLKYSDNQSLVDIISQHFFKATPTFFALSYFGVYLDYYYPLGGTRVFPEKLTSFIKENAGEILTKAEVIGLDIEKKEIKITGDKRFTYKKIVWAADSKKLYELVDKSWNNQDENQAFNHQKKLVEKNTGGDSILAVYMGVDLDKNYFRDKGGGHFFYTPRSQGISSLGLEEWDSFERGKTIQDEDYLESLEKSISEYLELTTYEIAIPVLRDENLAPTGKTGLIASVLIDYKLIKNIKERGNYEDFKTFVAKKIIKVLTDGIFDELEENVDFFLVSTPLTIEERTGNYNGAITGWSFIDSEMASETRLKKIAKSINTSIPHIYQAGQWTFSPSGLPIALMTGKMAADEIEKTLKNKKR